MQSVRCGLVGDGYYLKTELKRLTYQGQGVASTAKHVNPRWQDTGLKSQNKEENRRSYKYQG